MKARVLKDPSVKNLIGLFLVLFVFLAIPTTVLLVSEQRDLRSQAATVSINPGQIPQTVINANPAGTSFLFKAGVHRSTVIGGDMMTPRSGDIFIGEPGAVISGAKLLTIWIADGSIWRIDGQTQAQGQVRDINFCKDLGGGVRQYGCQVSEDLFLNDTPLRHVGTKAEVGPGKWHFDYAGDKIYVGDNPAGKTVEVSQGRHAFFCNGACDNVTVRDLTIEKFANPGQFGAIQLDKKNGIKPKNWLIENNTIRLNHGAGIDVSDLGIVRNNKIIRNGQLGLHGTDVQSVLVEGNEIAYNNFAGFSDGWEAGGFKFATNVSNLTVRNNHSHHNDGPGMWTDFVNATTIYENNIIEYNTTMGIEHEISRNAIIRNNTVRYNSSPGTDAWAFGAGIMVQNSDHVEVYGNKVIVPNNAGDGITVVHQERIVDGILYAGVDNYIHDNEVWVLNLYSDQRFAACICATHPSDAEKQRAYSTNRFNFNKYHVPALTENRWGTNSSNLTWTQFRAAGQEANGTADTNLTLPPDGGGSCNKPADFNCDNLVNGSDLALIVTKWGSNDAAADINDSGRVDAADLAILISNWGS